MKKHYYIEFKSVNSSEPFDIQSKWFKSEKAAIKWLKDSFDFICESEIGCYLMSATFDDLGDIMGDLEQEKRLIRGDDY